MQVKVISCDVGFTGDHGNEIEKLVNEWLSGHSDVRIAHMVQSQSYGQQRTTCTISIFYEAKDSK